MGALFYIRAQLAGAWGVMNGRSSGLSLFDLSVAGFWRSFGAIVLIVPLYLVALQGERAWLGEEAALPATGPLVALALSALALEWVAFPALLALIAGKLDLSRRYVPFVVARNWTSVWMAGLGAAPSLLHALGLLPAQAMPLVLIGLLALALRFSYLVARVALDVPAALAVPIVVLEFLIGLLVELGLSRLAFDQ